MVSLERLKQSDEERAIRDDEVEKVHRWIKQNVSNGSGAKWFILHALRRSAHRD